jgi:hypothetical protein
VPLIFKITKMRFFKNRIKLRRTISNPAWWKVVANKVRRTYLCYFDPEYVKENEAARVGECVGCGKCCTLVFRCVFLEGSDEQSRCKIYTIGRPKPCGAFPIDPKDLADVNFLCGYSFVPVEGRDSKVAYPSIPPVEVTTPLEPAFNLIRKIRTSLISD